MGSWGDAVSSPIGVWGKAPAAKSFGAFWILQVSSPAVLLLDLGVIHTSFCASARKFSSWLTGWSRKMSNYCGGENISIAGQRPVAPTVPTPLFSSFVIYHKIIGTL